MNLDYHYYATYVAARLANYSDEDARIIAYAAQLVDDFNEDDYAKLFAGCADVKFTAFSLDKFKGYAAQSVSDDRALAKVWMPFHFLPTLLLDFYNSSGAKEKAHSDFLCGNGGCLFDELSNSCMQGNTLEFLGMAMHIIADTYAHWGFAGFRSNGLNNVDSDGSLSTGEKFCPHEILGIFAAIGHTALGHYPDLPYLRITYQPNWATAPITRDNPNNFTTAFSNMFSLLSCANGIQPTPPNIDAVLARVRDLLATNPETPDGSQAGLWTVLIHDLFGVSIPSYDKYLWYNEFCAAELKENTHLFRFAGSAKSHWENVNNVLNFENFDKCLK